MGERVQGLAAVVTAAGHGIGQQIAIQLAAEGARVAASDINETAAAATAQLIRAAGGEAESWQCDARDSDAVDALAAFCREKWGGLDIWVNNAGGSGFRRLHEHTDEEWRQQIALNLDSTFYGLRTALRNMIGQKSGGSIVNISSGAGVLGVPGLSPYGAAKAGIISLTKTAALENARRGIRVNCIVPGAIDTGWTDTLPEGREAYEKNLVAGRMGRPEEIADAVLFLASSKASYVNGAILTVDGGDSSKLSSSPLAE